MTDSLRRVSLVTALIFAATVVIASEEPARADPCGVCTGTASAALDIGTVGGTFSQATAIDNGMIIGQSSPAGDNQRDGFLWTQADGMIDLTWPLTGARYGSVSAATAIHNGFVAGYADYGDAGYEHAFIRKPDGGIVEFGTLGGNASYFYSIHNGLAAGASNLAGNVEAHAVVGASDGVLVDLGTLGGSTSWATAINNGVVVGYSTIAGDLGERPFLWTAETGMVDLGTFGGGGVQSNGVCCLPNRAFAVRNGVVVGFSSFPDLTEHAFRVRWTGSAQGLVMEDLGTLGGSGSFATAVDDDGTVIGQSSIAGDTAIHSCRWAPDGTIEDLDVQLGGANNSAADIDHGEVVGQADTGSSLAAVSTSDSGGGDAGGARGYRWKSGAVEQLPTLGGTFTEALAIRASQAVGSATTPHGDEHGILWVPRRCPAAPQSCRAAAKSSLTVRDYPNDRKDGVKWKWVHGASTGQSDFGDPSNTTDYTLCVYVGSPAVLLDEIQVDASGMSWQALPTGYRYRAGRARGMRTKIDLQAGDNDRARIVFRAKGTNLPDPALGGVSPPLTVQLFASDTSTCWGSTFAHLSQNDTDILAAAVP